MYFPLDLFRFNIANTPSNAAAFTSTPRELRPGQTSVTSDTSNSWLMSTGVAHGDGRQASHWKDNASPADPDRRRWIRISAMEQTFR